MTQSSVFQLCELQHTELQQMLHDPALAACCSEASGEMSQAQTIQCNKALAVVL